MRVSALATMCLVLWFCAAARAADDPATVLLDGVKSIDAPGATGVLCVYGPQAFVIATGKTGAQRAAAVAAAQWEKGRVVALAHDGYLDPKALDVGDTGKMLLNAVRWAASSTERKLQTVRVGVWNNSRLAAWFEKHGLAAVKLDANWSQKLNDIHVLCGNPDALAPDAARAAAEAFIKNGGGLVAASCGWGWQQLNAQRKLAVDHAGNRLLTPVGIVWADGTLEHTCETGFTTTEKAPEFAHGGRALDFLLKREPNSPAKDVAQAAGALTLASRSLPPSDTLLLPRLKTLLQDAALAPVPTHAKPLKADRDALPRLVLTLQLEALKNQPIADVRAHPAAAEFPGAVPADAARVTRTVNIDTQVPEWHSTGLYAAPGEVVTISVPENAAGKFRVRIGAHRDHLWHLESWPRVPEISRDWPLTATETKVASAFGGLVYIEVPRGVKIGEVAVTVAGAVEAPYFVAGKTKVEAWKAEIRERKAPWAELECKRVVLTLPSNVIRTLDDPEALLAFWNRVPDTCAELAGGPLDRERPERYVADEEISAGYMHSGYPIMTHLDAAKPFVDMAWILSGREPVWGFFHEMGHNHQSRDWTFDGTGEVTVNLFTRYCLEKCCGIPTEKQRNRGKKAQDAAFAFIASGADFAKWKNDPFLALSMYDQLQSGFGWDAFKKVFAVFRDLPKDQHPRTDAERRDQWMVRFSQTVGKNLGPFFQGWGVPTSAAARASIAQLPLWVPEGWPLKLDK